MPPVNKVGTQLLVSPHLLDRARALAIVRKEQVAEVWRTALENAGLPALEARHVGELEKLHTALDALEGIRGLGTVDKSNALHLMLTSKPRYGVDDLYDVAGRVKKRAPWLS